MSAAARVIQSSPIAAIVKDDLVSEPGETELY